MKEAGQDVQRSVNPEPRAAPPSRGQSGEGSRSALEELILQRSKREAQQPREGEGPPPGRR